MATRSRNTAGRRREAEPDGGKRTRFRWDAFGVGLFACAALAMVSLARPSLGGVIGAWLADILRFMFGVGSWVCALFLGYLGFVAISDREHHIARNKFLGSAIITFIVLWGLQIIRAGLNASPSDTDRFIQGGGWIGAQITAVMAPLLGGAGTWIVIAALAVLAGLLLREATLKDMAGEAGERIGRGAQVVTNGASRLTSRGNDESAGTRRRQPAIIETPFSSETTSRDTGKRGRSAPVVDPWPSAEAETPATPGLPFAEPSKGRKSKGSDIPPSDSGGYVLPSSEILDPPSAPIVRSRDEADETIKRLEATLGHFGIEARVVEVACGPTVTRYEIQLAPGILVSKIESLADNVAMDLAAISVRVEAPIPGKSAIGIEVPNRTRAIVSIRECIETPQFKSYTGKLPLALGVDVSGKPVYADLATMPHVLIGGSTNSGKSVCLHSILAGFLFRFRPDQLKLILIDPKRVELRTYDGIPHLIHPVVQDPKQASAILAWACREMDQRYSRFVRAEARNITGFNERLPEGETPMPYIVIVVDEMHNLMINCRADVEEHIQKLATLARAAGIHLILATQRPSVDVITGTIKANISSRIAFAVATHTDSRTILDANGAERLVGRGDMLFQPMEAAKATRVQGPFISDREIERLVEYVRSQGEPDYIATIPVNETAAGDEDYTLDPANDEKWEKAVRLVVTTGRASASMIQRRLGLGYVRASRLVEMMEEQGIVGPQNGQKPREVLVNRADLDIMFPGGGDYPSDDPYDE
jgi:S-DNA-T family DNA segregation ATPase FtsK/SpoIIIE